MTGTVGDRLGSRTGTSRRRGRGDGRVGEGGVDRVPVDTSEAEIETNPR